MIQKLIIGSLLAGTAMHIIGFISWMVLPWHQPDQLTNTAPLTEAVKTSITQTGVYWLPGMTKPDGTHMTDAECEASMKQGPMMYALIRPGANDRSMGSYISMGWGGCVLMAIVLGLILSRVPLGYACLVKMSGMIGLLISVVSWIPQMNWWDYPVRHVWPYFADNIVMMLVAGAILGRFVKQDGATCRS
jgi:hypothetical protein